MEVSEKEVVITADAVDGSWVYRNAPSSLRPYLKLARLDRPVGTWLLLWPCLWSVLLTGETDIFRLLSLFALFAVGALVMRGAGCTYNDIVDRDFDSRVARTASRPIPAGEVTLTQAWGFLGIQCLIGLAVLLQFDTFAVWVGLASLLLVALYPFMKRITYWPQAWLGMTFNWGALMGWAAIEGSLSVATIILYVGAIFWTLGYDTIYAHQDKEDDALIGVKSTALALGENTQLWVAVFYGLFTISLIAAGWLANVGTIYYISAVIAGLQLGWQVIRVDVNNPDMCLTIFRSNTQFGWVIFLGLITDSLLA